MKSDGELAYLKHHGVVAPKFESVEEILEHHGIKGQKWGVRRAKTQLSKGSEDFERTKSIKIQGKTSGPHTLSNADMRAAIERMNLEQQYSRLNTPPGAKKFVRDLLANSGKQNAQKLVGKGLGAAVGLAIGATLSFMKK